MPTDTAADDLYEQLDYFGELHVTLASGAEAHLHRHDVTVTDEFIEIDSRRGYWRFDARDVEAIEVPDSHYDAP